MSAFTPGPWELHHDLGDNGNSVRICVLDPTVGRGCRAIGEAEIIGVPRAEAEANARLMAKAPELLARCKELREALAGAMRVIAGQALREGLADDEALVDTFVAEMNRLQIVPGVGVRADDLIAHIEGRPRPVPIDLEDLTL